MKKYLITLGVVVVLGGCSTNTYQGRTAEQWFNEYDKSDAETMKVKQNFNDYVHCINYSDSLDEAQGCNY